MQESMEKNMDVIVRGVMDEAANESIAWKTSGRLAINSYLNISMEVQNHMVNEKHSKQQLYYMDSRISQATYPTGSYNEGIPASFCSDIDMMRWFSIFPTVCWQPPENSDKYSGGFVVAEAYEDEPAYLRLKVINGKCLNHKFQSFIDNSGYLKSSSLMESNFKSMKNNTPGYECEIHGPSVAITGQAVETSGNMADLVYCLLCQSWPSITDSYFIRKRQSNWPPQKLLEKISHLDCLVVASGRAGSLSKDVEWRLSFSVAERKLIHEMPEQLANSMFALKAIKKKYKLFECDEQKPFSSYFIKTACLWVSEEIPYEKTMNSLRKVLDWLINCYENRNLPHYFIPQQNLIGHISRELCNEVQETLTTVKESLWVKVMSSIEIRIPHILKTDDYAAIESELINQPFTTDFMRMMLSLTDFLKLNRLSYSLGLIQRYKSSTFFPYYKAVVNGIDHNVEISEIIKHTEDSILPLIGKLETIVIEGYERMFKTIMYRLLGEVITSALVCYRNKCSPEDLSKYQNKTFQYYNSGAEMIFYPDEVRDYGLGSQALIVKFHYLMCNYKELKEELTDFRNLFDTCDGHTVIFPIIEIGTDESDLSYREWKVDKLFHSVIKRQNKNMLLSLITIVLYIEGRVSLNEGDTNYTCKIVNCLKQFIHNFPSTEILVNIIESLIGLAQVMQMIWCNHTVW